jgi:hypothetical protein
MHDLSSGYLFAECRLSTDREKTAPYLPTQIHKMTDPTTQQRSYPSRQASSLFKKIIWGLHLTFFHEGFFLGKWFAQGHCVQQPIYLWSSRAKSLIQISWSVDLVASWCLVFSIWFSKITKSHLSSQPGHDKNTRSLFPWHTVAKIFRPILMLASDFSSTVCWCLENEGSCLKGKTGDYIGLKMELVGATLSTGLGYLSDHMAAGLMMIWWWWRWWWRWWPQD